MFLETIGIGLIIPFMQVLITDDVNQYLIKFLNIFSIYPTSKYNLVFILILLLAFVYTFKALFLTYSSYMQTKLLINLRFSLANKLYDINIVFYDNTIKRFRQFVANM